MSICVGGVATVRETREVGATDGCTGEMLQRMGGGVAMYRVLQQTVGEVLQPTGKVGATDGWTEAVATMQWTGGRRCNKRLGKCCTLGEVLQRMVGRCCNKCN